MAHELPTIDQTIQNPFLTPGKDGLTGRLYTREPLVPVREIIKSRRDDPGILPDPSIIPLGDIVRPGIVTGDRDRVILNGNRVIGHVRQGYAVEPLESVLRGLAPDLDSKARVTYSGDMKSRTVLLESLIGGTADDPKAYYVRLTEHMDGRGLLRVTGCTFRAWCNNGASSLLGDLFREIQVRHNGTYTERFAEVMAQVQALHNAFMMQDALEKDLRRIPMTTLDVSDLAICLFPAGDTPTDRRRAELARDRFSDAVYNTPGGASDLGLNAFTLLEGVTAYDTQYGNNVRVKSKDSDVDPDVVRADRFADSLAESVLPRTALRHLRELSRDVRDLILV